MKNYFVSDQQLNSIANAICAKGNIPNGLEFPDGFINAINNLSVNKITIPRKDVNFIDYDGTIVYSYTTNEFLSLTSMPQNPDHSRDEIPLTSQGWNWSLLDAQEYVRKHGVLEIGQMYVTTDGKTYFKIYINEFPRAEKEVTLTWIQSVDYGVYVDWGDDDETQEHSQEGIGICSLHHSYQQSGWYTITLNAVYGTMTFPNFEYPLQEFDNSEIILPEEPGKGIRSNKNLVKSAPPSTDFPLVSFLSPSPLFTISNDDNYELTGDILHEVRFGIIQPVTIDEITCPAQFGDAMFYNYFKLTSISIPSNITRIGERAFTNTKLNSITLPNNIEINGYAFAWNAFLTSISLPNTIDYIPEGMCSECISLIAVTIPDYVEEIGNYAFFHCSDLSYVSFSEDLEIIHEQAFESTSLRFIDLGNTIVSTISEYAFAECNKLDNIIFPDSLTDINNHAFFECSNLYLDGDFPYLEYISSYAFCNIKNIGRVSFRNLNYIGENAFNLNWEYSGNNPGPGEVT